MIKYRTEREGSLFRIYAVRSFGDVKEGTRGGLIESESNLSHNGECWVGEDALVFGNALVTGNAVVTGNALVFGNALVTGNAVVTGSAQISSPLVLASRSDGYDFALLTMADGSLAVSIGSQLLSFSKAREHWQGTPLSDETSAILDHLARMAVIRGFVKGTRGSHSLAGDPYPGHASVQLSNDSPLPA